MIQEFRLSPAGEGGVSCDKAGAFIASIPILERVRRSGRDVWQPRDCADLSERVSAQYGLPVDLSSKAGGIAAIARALNAGDVARAQIAALLLRIPDPLPLSKAASSRQDIIALVRDLDWSGMLKWDPDEHPRWPAASAEGRGGEFAPKDGAGAAASESSARARRANPVIDDAVFRPGDQASAIIVDGLEWRPSSRLRGGAPKLIPVAGVEDERDPRLGIGGNYMPPDELIPQQLIQSQAGPAVQFLDNLLELTAPAEELNLALARAQAAHLLHAIHDVDPNYVYESIAPEGGLAGMSWQQRRTVIFGLQADLAAAIYRVRGDIRPLQEVTLEFMQRAANEAYNEAVASNNEGSLKIRLSSQEAIGNYVDGRVRNDLRNFFKQLRISTDPGSPIRVNNRAYDSSTTQQSYRIPDLRIGNFAFDTSVGNKSLSDPQIRGFFSADFAPVGVVIVRPNQLGGQSSYVIWRPKGD